MLASKREKQQIDALFSILFRTSTYEAWSISYNLKSSAFAQHIKTLHEIVANEAVQDGRILLANFSAGHSCIPFQTSGSASLRIQIQPSRRHKGRRFAEESDLRNGDRPLCSQAKAVKKEFVLTD